LFGFPELQFPFLQSLLKLVYFKNQPLRNADGVTVSYWMKTMKEEDQIKMNNYFKKNGMKGNLLMSNEQIVAHHVPNNDNYLRYLPLLLILLIVVLQIASILRLIKIL
jgi:hypothetical protein